MVRTNDVCCNNDGMADNNDVYDHGPALFIALLMDRVEHEPLVFVDEDRNVNVTRLAKAGYNAEIQYHYNSTWRYSRIQ